MNRIFISIIVVVAVIAGLLVFQATRETSHAVLLPSDLTKVDAPKSRTRIRIGGRVADTPIEYTVEPTIVLKFKVHDPAAAGAQPQNLAGSLVPVTYYGLKPDNFTAGRDVIIDGEYKDGMLLAQKLLTQCPSKYEPPSPDEFMKKRESK